MAAEIPKEYDAPKVEEKWQKRWEELEIYRYKEKPDKPTYVIDTPPPYTSGCLHLGHALNYTYIDIVARFKRMQGYNVYFPQGWDCHGLPTEVQVEKQHNITKREIPRQKFIDLCIQLTKENKKRMRKQLVELGYSTDWNLEYTTMDPYYVRAVQLSFLELLEKGEIYRGTHPVNWCPRCETAIADAEVEYEERDSYLYYLHFPKAEGKEYISIATTRPELLPACVTVAVHPEDERHQKLIGGKVKVPLFNQEVEVIADSEVDPEFGTGIVMICTFGDKTDIEWVARHDLPIIKAINKKGEMTDAAGKYVGLKLAEAKKAIITDLEKEGLLEKKTPFVQSVGVCWRCGTPREFLVTTQWFVNVLDHVEEIINAGRQIEWCPEYMVQRLIDWANSLEWDWVISRQRIFATPIPVWYCKNCGEVVPADSEQLPVDPIQDTPPIKKCPVCGGTKFEGERDVLDTWMDSSISPLIIVGWPDDREKFKKLFPTSLRPQGHEIIRTWAFYTLLRSLLLTEKIPWRTMLVNGMVLAPDGRKMSKSLGNVVEPEEALEKYGADAIRQWVGMGGATGSDIKFDWKEVIYGSRFLRKFWNVVRFTAINMGDFDPETLNVKELMLQPLDRWILSELHRLIKAVNTYMNECRFNRAVIEIHQFTWGLVADHYLEMVKHRIYNPAEYGEDSEKAALWTLYHTLLNISQLLAPLTPHIAEETYQLLAKKPAKSIHLTTYPKHQETFIDPAAEKLGEIAIDIASAVRKYKTKQSIALSAEIPEATVYAETETAKKALNQLAMDLSATLKINQLKIKKGKPPIKEKITALRPVENTIGPQFRGKTKKILEKLQKTDPVEVAETLEKNGKYVVQLTPKEEIELTPEHIKFDRELATPEGKTIQILEPKELEGILISIPKK